MLIVGDRMKINWDKKARKQEEIIVAAYIEDKISILENLLDLYIQENLLTISWTPNPLNGNYYTYELKYHRHREKYLINVWKGVRTGDALPILYGDIQF